MQKKHFDAWGNPILDFLSMLNYFSGDQSSLHVIRSRPSHRYIVIPETRIFVDKGLPAKIKVSLFWPGGSRTVCINGSQHILRALRRLYTSPEVTWRKLETDRQITFIHKGRIIPCDQSIYAAL